MFRIKHQACNLGFFILIILNIPVLKVLYVRS